MILRDDELYSMNAIKRVIKRSGTIVNFNQKRITNAIYRAAVSVGGRDKELAEKLSKRVVIFINESYPAEYIPSIEEIQDAVEKTLIENGHAKVAKAYIIYRNDRAQRRKDRATIASKPSQNIPWAKIWHILDWAVAHKLNSIELLNERIEKDEFADIVAESEKAYTVDLENAIELIAEKLGQLKLVIISGPSSSGKTTTTLKISQHLNHFGTHLVTLNVDNYFFDLEMHPKDEFGDYDFETPQALDLELINKHIIGLLNGEEILVPFYDFKTGQRHDEQTPMRINPGEIILIDSLHGSYPDMTEGISPQEQFKLYLEPLMQMKDCEGNYIRWTDLRLIRRMLRDASHRAYDPRKTLTHWHYVRASEMRNIIPQIYKTDYIINSAMPYEIALYRPRLLDQFASWIQDYQNDPLQGDAYERAVRVNEVLQSVIPVDDDAPVPGDSVLREFIGGSSFQY